MRQSDEKSRERVLSTEHLFRIQSILMDLRRQRREQAERLIEMSIAEREPTLDLDKSERVAQRTPSVFNALFATQLLPSAACRLVKLEIAATRPCVRLNSKGCFPCLKVLKCYELHREAARELRGIEVEVLPD